MEEAKEELWSGICLIVMRRNKTHALKARPLTFIK